MDDDIFWMGVALDEADTAAAHHDVPVGAVVVRRDGVELARAHNRREADSSPIAHAETLALDLAARQRGHWRLDDCTLYVTLEPCTMCAGALVNARIGRLVYGAADPKAGAIESLFELGRDARLNHRFESSGGVRADECALRLSRFFAELRRQGQK